MILISYLMPSFNSGGFLEIAVKSVLAQMGPQSEVIIQDGGSSDGSLRFLSDLCDSRVSVVSASDAGQSDALNKALQRASGAWVSWVNSDDLVFWGGEDTLRGAIANDHEAQVVYGNYSTIDEHGKVIRSFAPGPLNLDDLLFRAARPFNGAMFIRKDLLDQVGGFRRTFDYCMDYELYLRLWNRNPRTVYVPQNIGALRIHGVTKTSLYPWRFVKEAHRARVFYLRGSAEHVRAFVQTFRHASTVATTRLRSSRFYLRIRHGYVKN